MIMAAESRGQRLFENQGSEQDTARTDTLSQPKPAKQIEPDTRLIDRLALFRYQDPFSPAVVDIARVTDWDPLSEEPGFVLHLGQIGKPYLSLINGVSDDHYVRPDWQNWFTGRYNRFVKDPEWDVAYYDTKTPYVNVDFVQGARRLQMVDVTISQNISPWWNMTAFYGRKQAVGAYSAFTTDHKNLYLSSHIQSRNGRYHAFTNAVFNELLDEINGGINRPAELTPEEAFGKGLSRTNLTNAQLAIRQKSLYLDHSLQLAGLKDTTGVVQKISLRNVIMYEYAFRRFRDEDIDVFNLDNNLVPVLPTLSPGSDRIVERYDTRRFVIRGGASYLLHTGIVELEADAHINFRYHRFDKDSIGINQSILEEEVHAILGIPSIHFTHDFSFRNRTSNLFAAETRFANRSELQLPFSKLQFRELDTLKSRKFIPDTAEVRVPVRKPPAVQKDSVSRDQIRYRPVKLRFQQILFNRNPSVFQSYYISSPENTFMPDPGLRNELFNHLSLEIRYDDRKPVWKEDVLDENYVYFKGFISRRSNPIYYTRLMELRQGASGENLSWVGAEAGFRIRFLRKLYWENRAIIQRGSTGGSGDLLYYAVNQPKVYGKSSLYYDNRSLSFAAVLRAGIDVHFRTAYTGMTFDPVSGEFFPADFREEVYFTADVFWAAQIKRAYIFLKVGHVNEGLFTPGYYSVPFYPMLERSFSLGVNWTFFD
jgi:hypothetical protein